MLGGAVKANCGAPTTALDTAGVTTSTSALPGASGGATASIWVSDSTVNELAGTEPNKTDVAPVKPLPVMVTPLSPVLAGPVLGLSAVTTDRVAYEKLSAADAALVVDPLLTRTSTVPVPGGEVTWSASDD